MPQVHPLSPAVIVGMYLFLSHRSPLKSIYSNEDGQAIYKVHSPFKFKDRTCSISRIMPDIPNNDDMQDRFVHLAQIDWKMMSPSTIRFGENAVDVKTFFRKEGFGGFGR